MKSKVEKKKNKFYRPGKLLEKGTKVSIKTQPYVNNLVFDLEDPITCLHSHLSSLSLIVNQYEFLTNFANLEKLIGSTPVSKDEIKRVKSLLDFLVLSPIEVTLKDQIVNEEVLNEIRIGEKNEQ